ncbi:hypothetical protein MGG_00834 [Pyricularia oryzae 70-15]|uniref:Uncharacterized protein n=3 Tax=Pyricularia oryzae TaxID=318829 RepID=G4NE28_PYRO7|nr:uncharacterized protein MGG_00834 [Pyricularia oryzae 70-15]EHA48563.1 hypothetical protein MGG_00834 [Pyricularia oryzae 70-15]ELQ43802.1 hypothetical protein OOU_Y34scaffold00126g5 [Pyricularia oryzae Y34]KAI7912604.1 hypothetical protein M9X92_009919 [Pyricularia oryzae]KAI7920749.1 hypothetical protein M0657_006442 [Pyricularia oryzae]
MSKEDTEAAPPPYSETAFPTTSTIPSRSPGRTRPPSPSSPLSSHLAAHLSSLSTRLRQTQSARATRQALLDLDLVERIVPHVEAFLADVVDAHSRPAAAELTIVPAPAVPSAWALSGAAERRREGELVHLVRLAVPGVGAVVDDKGRPRELLPQGRDGKGGGSAGEAASPSTGSSLRPERDWTATQFDEWGRWDEDAEAAAMAAAGGGSGGSSSWWWRDEGMAERLAAHLQPRPPVRTERREIQAAVVQAKEEKKSGWGLWRKKSSSSTVTPASPVAAAVSPVSPVLEQDDGVRMTVRADEVTFRRENDFGVWESMSGWGIVVTIAVR